MFNWHRQDQKFGMNYSQLEGVTVQPATKREKNKEATSKFNFDFKPVAQRNDLAESTTVTTYNEAPTSSDF
jgi:hypothetical protein